MVVFLLSLFARFMIVDALGIGDEWPGFRGPKGTGVSEEANLPERWGSQQNVAWRTEVPGRGWSSPIVWGEFIFLTTAVPESDGVEFEPGIYMDPRKLEPVVQSWLVLCLDSATGDVLWEEEVHQAVPAFPRHLHGEDLYLLVRG